MRPKSVLGCGHGSDFAKTASDLGELSAMEWLGSRGYGVFYPIGHSPDRDLIADDGRTLQRVQVKTTTRCRHGRWEVMVCTRGGNRSWSGNVKHLDPTTINFLFVLVGDGRRWFIPSNKVGGGSGVVFGGPKYADFEIEAGRRLPSTKP